MKSIARLIATALAASLGLSAHAADLPGTQGAAPASLAGGRDFQSWLKETLERRPR